MHNYMLTPVLYWAAIVTVYFFYDLFLTSQNLSKSTEVESSGRPSDRVI